MNDHTLLLYKALIDKHITQIVSRSRKRQIFIIDDVEVDVGLAGNEGHGRYMRGYLANICFSILPEDSSTQQTKFKEIRRMVSDFENLKYVVIGEARYMHKASLIVMTLKMPTLTS